MNSTPDSFVNWFIHSLIHSFIPIDDQSKFGNSSVMNKVAKRLKTRRASTATRLGANEDKDSPPQGLTPNFDALNRRRQVGGEGGRGREGETRAHARTHIHPRIILISQFSIQFSFCFTFRNSFRSVGCTCFSFSLDSLYF